MLSAPQVSQLNTEFENMLPKDILAQMSELIPNSAMAFSGAEDVAIIDMAVKQGLNLAVFTLDTGRLHPETYRFLEEVRTHYEIQIETLFPDANEVTKLTKNKGLFSFYTDGHEECCKIRKVQPLRQKLKSVDAWITGQRQDQSPSRAEVPFIEIDSTFSTEDHQVIKINPLAKWTSTEVWSYIRLLELPYNELHDKGMVSIGCEPCTRATGPGQHEREGRWWWEEATIKECGLHLTNLEK
ncbi:MAG: phosphoadenosine phosphosulfate reductase [Pseudohongiellaceae bacterium]|jgi:phosphoadenosine phosphosulfate reductase